MNDLPKEIRKVIYQKRALCILYDRVTQYNLNFNRLCDFLIRFNGVIAGSFILSCFDNTIKPKDLDIFIKAQNTNIKADFFQLIDRPNTMFGAKNDALDNSSEPSDKTERVIKFCGFGVDQLNMIDLVIVDGDIQRHHFDIGCSGILFNGIDWIFPEYIDNDIEKFILLKYCGMNPFKTYFSEIYDPWKYSTADSMVEDSSRFRLCRDVSNITPIMRPIYDHFINFYPEEIDSEINVSLSEGLLTLQSISQSMQQFECECTSILSGVVCQGCTNILTSITQTGIIHKYIPIGYQPYYINSKNQYLTQHYQQMNFVWADQDISGDWDDESASADETIAADETVPADEPNCDESVPTNEPNHDDAVPIEYPPDDEPNSNISYCPKNLIDVVQSIYPNRVIDPAINKINMVTYIKIYTIYKYWYRVLKYISRGYTIFGILDTLKNIINDVSLQNDADWAQERVKIGF